jgi:hypothetical protein
MTDARYCRQKPSRKRTVAQARKTTEFKTAKKAQQLGNDQKDKEKKRLMSSHILATLSSPCILSAYAYFPLHRECSWYVVVLLVCISTCAMRVNQWVGKEFKGRKSTGVRKCKDNLSSESCLGGTPVKPCALRHDAKGCLAQERRTGRYR